LSQAEARFNSEEDRTNHYLSPQTTTPLRQILEGSLLTPHLPSVIAMPNSGLDIMIDLDKADDLARLYRLAMMVPSGLPCLKKSLRQSVARRGKLINQASVGTEPVVDVEGDADDHRSDVKGKGQQPNTSHQTLQLALKWVQDVLDLKDKFDRVWRQSFQGDRDLESGLNEVRIHNAVNHILQLTTYPT
jgi:cullin 3